MLEFANSSLLLCLGMLLVLREASAQEQVETGSKEHWRKVELASSPRSSCWSHSFGKDWALSLLNCEMGRCLSQSVALMSKGANACTCNSVW